ncbi:PEP-CTERM sorting domain-containing protein [Adhaeretor mobilis]|uniref:PEP-CTERM protein-sorting domain-containing protein n=1 Tax=Adhaeretor mobilis TaxID=1930276 RepID=A0A517MT66_9BACT|nr:PEP-CTERM sorting domain-containing protein [Adhaeretor mobilis]QDS98068.1 hypothetical protein HG15A2_13400 [Adhaeretor mobilis]
MNIKRIVFPSFVLAVLAGGRVVQAGEISGFTWSSGVASVAGVSISPPPFPGNDDVIGDSGNVQVVAQKHYTGIGPVDIQFDVFTATPPGGTTEYLFQEGVDNSTPFDWSGYRIELGFGMGAGFVPSTPGDGLDFDAPDFSSPPDFSTFFSTLDVWTEDVIQVSGGLHPNGGGYSLPPYEFTIDVPDGITSFTLRQSPIAAVPEPTSLALLAACGLIAFPRRRRSQ